MSEKRSGYMVATIGGVTAVHIPDIVVYENPVLVTYEGPKPSFDYRTLQFPTMTPATVQEGMSTLLLTEPGVYTITPAGVLNAYYEEITHEAAASAFGSGVAAGPPGPAFNPADPAAVATIITTLAADPSVLELNGAFGQPAGHILPI